eukprot:24175-Chlamydomonas_euryale.AAC.2
MVLAAQCHQFDSSLTSQCCESVSDHRQYLDIPTFRWHSRTHTSRDRPPHPLPCPSPPSAKPATRVPRPQPFFLLNTTDVCAAADEQLRTLAFDELTANLGAWVDGWMDVHESHPLPSLLANAPPSLPPCACAPFPRCRRLKSSQQSWLCACQLLSPLPLSPPPYSTRPPPPARATAPPSALPRPPSSQCAHPSPPLICQCAPPYPPLVCQCAPSPSSALSVQAWDAWEGC